MDTLLKSAIGAGSAPQNIASAKRNTILGNPIIAQVPGVLELHKKMVRNLLMMISVCRLKSKPAEMV